MSPRTLLFGAVFGLVGWALIALAIWTGWRAFG